MIRLAALAALAVVLYSCTPEADTTLETGTDTTVATTTTTSTVTTTTTSTTTTIATTTTAPSSSGLTCWTADSSSGTPGSIKFIDITEDTGLIEPLKGMHGHAAVWLDVDGNDLPDLYVGTFADRPDGVYQVRGADGPSPDRLLVGDGEGFAVDDSLQETFARTSGGVGVDLDNDGDIDLVSSRNVKDPQPGQAPTQILENVDGALRVVEDSGIPADLGGRSVGVLDYDQDGRYDLFVVEDRFAGGSSALFRNEGDLRFRDVTREAGLPDGVHGLGVAVADFDDDGLADIFVAGSNRLFLSDEPGSFTEADSSMFEWETYGEEDDVAGVSVADVNRDGLLDLAVGHHYNSTVDFGEEVPIRLYLNEGEGRFRDVTEDAGLTGLPTKAPHVELNDFDNDGWPDLFTSASAGEGPAVFRHQGLEDGVPRFATPSGLGDPQYWVAAPSADYNRDGRLDVFLVEWEPSLPSLLLRNETASGNWLEVSVGSEHGSGLGWRVEVLDGDAIIGAREITVTQGYSAGVLPFAHFGLADLDEVDVRLTPRGDQDPILIESVMANQHVRWPAGC